MHAPITALLAEAILTGHIDHGRVRLPAPFEHAAINISRFEPGRAFERSGAEHMVL